jgi:hypothetical protein
MTQSHRDARRFGRDYRRPLLLVLGPERLFDCLMHGAFLRMLRIFAPKVRLARSSASSMSGEAGFVFLASFEDRKAKEPWVCTGGCVRADSSITSRNGSDNNVALGCLPVAWLAADVADSLAEGPVAAKVPGVCSEGLFGAASMGATFVACVAVRGSSGITSGNDLFMEA